MCLSVTNPTSPGRRHQKILSLQLLNNGTKILKLGVNNILRPVGRSTQTGHITARRHGGGVKRRYRLIQFLPLQLSVVVGVNYDPFRSAFVTLNFDLLTKTYHYQLASQNAVVGACISRGIGTATFFLGLSSPLLQLPAGVLFHNLSHNGKSCFVRSAGTYAQLLHKTQTSCLVRLPSNKVFHFPLLSLGTIGRVSNRVHRFQVLGKAGRSRLQGRRPATRGRAMNPVDHPHGGRTNGGRPSVTPWAKPALGQKTSNSRRREALVN